jgi:hypothetical protein
MVEGIENAVYVEVDSIEDGERSGGQLKEER